nr:MAG TPA: hypothetical protein [Crassvirales sp.]
MLEVTGEIVGAVPPPPLSPLFSPPSSLNLHLLLLLFYFISQQLYI